MSEQSKYGTGLRSHRLPSWLSAVWLPTLAFVIFRLAHLLAAPLPLHSIEELYTGTIATELARGPAFPLFDYQYEDYAGGSLVMGVYGAPWFKLLGPQFLTLKLMALAWSLAAFLVWMALLYQVLGAAGARAAGWFWAAAPFAFQRLSMMAWGNHTESILFTGLALLLLLRQQKRPLGRGTMLLCGVVNGFAIYFCYTSLVGVAVVLLVYLLMEPPMKPRGGWLWLLGGSVLGLFPGFLQIIVRGSTTLELYGRRLDQILLGSNPVDTIRRGWEFLHFTLPRALAPPPELGRLSVAAGWLLLLLSTLGAVAAARSVWRNLLVGELRGSKPRLVLLALLVYPPLFALAYALAGLGSSHQAHSVYAYRFLGPLLPFLAALFGAGVVALPRLRLLVVAPIGLACAAVISLAMGDQPDSRNWTAWKGHSYRWLGLSMLKEREPLRRELEQAARIKDFDHRQQCVLGLYQSFFRRQLEGPLWPVEGSSLDQAKLDRPWADGLVDAGLQPVAREALLSELRFRALTGRLDALEPDLLLKMGTWVVGETGPPPVELALWRACRQEPQQRLQQVNWILNLDPDLHGSAWQALGRCLEAAQRNELMALLGELDPEQAGVAVDRLYRGAGGAQPWVAEGRLLFTGAKLEAVPPDRRPAFVCGVLDQVDDVYGDDPILMRDLLGWVKETTGFEPACASVD